MIHTVTIDGTQLRMRASARVPFLYRSFFNRDIFADIQSLMDHIQAKTLDDDAVDVVERVAWVLTLNADPEALAAAQLTDTQEAFSTWLDQFDNVLTFMQAAYPILDMWIANVAALAVAKKNSD